MPGPGFEPGLLRPQRSVLTTRRSRRAKLLTADEKRKFFIFTCLNEKADGSKLISKNTLTGHLKDYLRPSVTLITF